MLPSRLGIVNAAVALVPDGSYPAVLRGVIATARSTCLCNQFLVDVRPGLDEKLSVYCALVELAGARWRGVDVRLLIGGSRENLDMAVASELGRATAGSLGVPCRWLTSRKDRGSHAKWVVSDNTVLIGSHNWSAGAFGDQTQDTILVQSDSLAAYLRSKFLVLWDRAGGVRENVPL